MTSITIGAAIFVVSLIATGIYLVVNKNPAERESHEDPIFDEEDLF